MALPAFEPVAHLEPDGRRHLLNDHLLGVASRAGWFASRFGAAEWGRLAGLWHDLGKFAANFQNMLLEANGFEAHLEEVAGTPRDHSTAGAVHALQALPQQLAVPLAYLVAGHHGGLPDRADLKARLEKTALLENALKGNPPADLLTPPALTLPAPLQGKPDALGLEMWLRFLYSALCDADFLDTEAFYEPNQARLRQPGAAIPALAADLDAYLGRLQANARPSEVNRVRAEVLEACRTASKLSPGVFSLTVPTGGGKTLSSLAFALRHAVANRLDRVIVAIPFTSIIEQTAEAYREALGSESVLEHHSALDPERVTARNRLAAENWEAPVVVTTTVQLFESLFANKPSSCRKLHRVARSVVILDEAQTLPIGLLEPIVDGLKTLARDFGTSVVICTATQPALGKSRTVPFGFEQVTEIVPDTVRAFERLQRVRVRWPSTSDPVPFDVLAREVAAEPDVLAIVHKRSDARALCEQLDGLLGNAETLHLSALMCAEHRSVVIADIKRRKQEGHAVRVVSTQLVEAGVDLDFAIAYRALGGLDSMAQAAGRCNREGRLDHLGELRVFVAESLPPQGVPRTALGVTQGLLARDPQLPLFAAQSYRAYFDGLYGARGPQELDSKGVQGSRRTLDFKTTAGRVKLIEDGWSAPLVVPYRGAVAAIDALEARGPNRETLRALQRYTVNVPRVDLERWLREGYVRLVGETVAVLDGAYSAAYDERFGLVPGKVGARTPGALIVDD